MADHFYSVDVGTGFDPSTSVTVGTSTSGKAIELRVHDGSSIKAVDVYKALEQLEGYFQKNSPTLA